MRGYRVFLDVDSLQEGDFADRTLKSVESVSAGFILILTAGALDKCAIDHEGTDWVHKVREDDGRLVLTGRRAM